MTRQGTEKLEVCYAVLFLFCSLSLEVKTMNNNMKLFKTHSLYIVIIVDIVIRSEQLKENVGSKTMTQCWERKELSSFLGDQTFLPQPIPPLLSFLPPSFPPFFLPSLPFPFSLTLSLSLSLSPLNLPKTHHSYDIILFSSLLL